VTSGPPHGQPGNGPYPTGPEQPGGNPYPQPSGPVHPWEPGGQASGGYVTGVSQVPYTGPSPVPQPSGSMPVAQPSAAQPVAQQAPPKSDWTYGLPPGVRPDLLKSPLGQHGAMAGSAWEQRGRKATSFFKLVVVELRKLVGTMSDRVLLALAPLALGLVTWYLTTDSVTAPPTSASRQIFGLIVACHLGPVPVYTVVLKTFSGEWHYRSAQLTLLLQPRRMRYAVAQMVAVLSLWLVMALVQFGLFYWLKPAQIASTPFQDYLGPRPLWVLGVALLASFLTLLFLMSIAFLVRNPTAAVTTYLLLSGLYLFRVTSPPPPGLWYVDPWQPASLLAGAVFDPIPSVTSGVVLVTLVVTGFVVFTKRDAR
jgi:hypothetical protein